MQPIELTPDEQAILRDRKEAVDNCRETLIFQASVDTIARLHGATGGWGISSNDLTRLIPIAPTASVVAPPTPVPATWPGPDPVATIPADGPQ